MMPGFIHFDVRRGCRADMLNAAMASLLNDAPLIKKTLESAGLFEVCFSLSDHVTFGVKGKTLQFYIGEKAIQPTSSVNFLDPCEQKLSQLRHCDNVIVKKETTGNFPLTKNNFLNACLQHQMISLDDVSKMFFNNSINPAVAALSLKIIENLRCRLFVEQKLHGIDALWLLCHLITLAGQVDALDPKFITSTKLSMGERKSFASSTPTLSLNDDLWLKHICSGLSVIEIKDVIESDVLGCAFIKTLSSNLGARGESTIIEIGIGISAPLSTKENGLVEAIWCEARMPASQSESGPSNRQQIVYLYEITGLVSAATEMSHLSSMLILHGAVSTSWHLVSCEKNQPYYQMCFYCDDNDKNSAIEAFLIKGNANSVLVRSVERHELSKRLVSVPIGTGNKISSIRFHEYLYLDKTVRVEPLKEDLDSYVDKTDYSVDVARGDLLMSWKKWRGRIVLEDA